MFVRWNKQNNCAMSWMFKMVASSLHVEITSENKWFKFEFSPFEKILATGSGCAKTWPESVLSSALSSGKAPKMDRRGWNGWFKCFWWKEPQEEKPKLLAKCNRNSGLQLGHWFVPCGDTSLTIFDRPLGHEWVNRCNPNCPLATCIAKSTGSTFLLPSKPNEANFGTSWPGMNQSKCRKQINLTCKSY